jgi:predicted Ser/Thr protein kinase
VAVASPDAILKALATLVCLAVGLVALSGRREVSARALATFLLLIAVNQGAETVRALAATEHVRVVAYRVASIAASLDPFVLSWFVMVLTRSESRRARFGLIVTAAISAVLALYAGWVLTPAHPWFDVSLSLFTGVVYGMLLFRVLRATMLNTTQGGIWLLAALALAALPASQRVVGNLFFIYGGPLAQLGYFPNHAIEFIPIGLVLGSIWWVVIRRSRDAPAPLRHTLVFWMAVAVFLVLISHVNFVVLAIDRAQEPLASKLEVLGRAEISLRWGGFGILASAALLRANELDFTLTQRRRAARVVVGLGLLVVLIIMLVSFSSLVGRVVGPVELMLLGIAAIASQGARRLIDTTATRLYGIPMPGDPIAAQDAYRRATIEVVARGGAPARDPALQRIREELGVDLGTAAIIERLAEETNAAPLRPGHLIAARYHIERALGRGGSGRVFLANDVRIQRRVVLKEVFVDAPSDDALREARLAGALQHPRIATVYDVIPRGDSMLLVQEFAVGGSLADLLRTKPPEAASARLLLRQIIEGAAAVHAAGISHGDIKPDNVLLNAHGEPKLADFGIARHSHGSTVAMESVLTGTPEYLAPERMRGALGSPEADVYSLGLLGRRLLGMAPPEEWESVLARALQPDPSARFAHAGEMLAALPHDQ